MSTDEAAAKLGISRRQVQALILDGQLPAQRVGRSYVVRAEDLEQFERRPVGRPRKGEGE
jgi:excisionase family DNA binding protein